MTFAHGRTVHRQRAKTITDPYSKKQVNADWTDPDEIEIPGAFIGQSSTSLAGGASRSQALEAKSLFCDPGVDVIKGDRIRDGDVIYTIDGIPAADTNPFTGWTPVKEIPLTRSVG